MRLDTDSASTVPYAVEEELHRVNVHRSSVNVSSTPETELTRIAAPPVVAVHSVKEQLVRRG